MRSLRRVGEIVTHQGGVADLCPVTPLAPEAAARRTAYGERVSSAIRRVEVFGYRLTYVHGEYVMSRGRRIAELASTVVRVTTEDGVEGFGEVCPLGPAYLPQHAEGARAALRVIAPAVLGLSVENVAAVNVAIDGALCGSRLRQERGRRRLLGRARETVGRPVPVARRPAQRALPPLLRGPARLGGRDGGVRRRPAGGGHSPLPAEARLGPAGGRRAHAARRRGDG